MSETPQQDSGSSPMVRNILLVLAGIYVIGSIVFVVQAFSRMDDMEKKQAAREAEFQKAIEQKFAANTSQTNASLNALAKKVGMSHQELAQRAAAIQKEEKGLETKVAEQEEQNKQQFGAISGDITGVKGTVGQVQQDVTSTKTDLEATKSKLDHAIGDLNKQSEFIATTHDELEVLKHKGDKNYFEFTLLKGKDPTHVAAVGLQLKKVDPKKAQFTLYVMADDKRIEKKDRSVNEPLQFYTGRDHYLYEVVVNSVDKNQVTGYLVAPKGANVGPVDHAAQGTQN
ncbi:MAG TPA: hypothetical protein VKZ53_03100 [Candidatus Angelobacter sp.]|nr:hypothetical protein [Candidatus Angelobacter sp.]